MADEVAARGSCCGNCLPARYVMGILGSIGMAILYALKVNLSVAMVAMLNNTAIAQLKHPNIQHNLDNDTMLAGFHLNKTLSMSSLAANFSKQVMDATQIEVCEPPGGETNSTNIMENGPFVWNEPLQGVLLSCYFWGYIAGEMPGAYLAENYSAKWTMMFAVGINVICTILTPYMTKLHYIGLIVMRVLEGIGGGTSFPAMHCLIAAWTPPNERSVMSTIIYMGLSFGTAFSILGAGVLTTSYGWESVFYIQGGVSAIWLIFWLIFVQDNANKQPYISIEEREMINSQLGNDGHSHHQAVPWKAVFTSKPFWAILIAHCCSNWGWYMLLIEIPFYMKQVLKFNVSSNAALSALPYFPMLIFSIILGKTLDVLRAKQKINTSTARKVATSFSSIVPAICLLGLCFIGCKHTAAVIIMSLSVVGMGGMFSGFLSNHIDIAPNFAATLVGITNTAATMSGILVPLFVGVVTEDNHTIEAWQKIFGVTIILFAIEFVVFTLFGSGEEQPWNKSGVKKDSVETIENTPLKITNLNY